MEKIYTQAALLEVALLALKLAQDELSAIADGNSDLVDDAVMERLQSAIEAITKLK